MNLHLDLAILLLVNLFILFLGFLTFIHNSKSINNRLYLAIAIISMLWSIANYFSLNPIEFIGNLLMSRVVLFLAILHSFLLLVFVLQFPNEDFIILRRKRNIYLSLLILLIAFLALTPAYFKDLSYHKGFPEPIPGSLMPLLASYFTLVVFSSLVAVFKKVVGSKNKQEKIKNAILLGSISTTYFLLFYTQFFLTNFSGNSSLLPYGPLFMLPLISGTAYAILRHQAMDVKVFSTELFVFLVLFLSASQIIISSSLLEIALRTAIFSSVFLLSILLIKTMHTEIKQKEKLEELNKELEELSRIKSEFLSFASHQIKAPMAVVKGYAELIESENASEKIQGFAHEIRTAVDKLLALIEQFLDYRKIEEGKVKFNFEDIDLVSLIKEMIKNFSVIAKSKKLELKFETQSEHCIVKADSLRLPQVIQNLIDNAIKYTSSGEVSVELKKEDNYVLITVADSGRGIPKEIQPKLFGEFIRDPAIKKEIAGTGLGLYISKYIIDAHNGKIWVESEGVGKGSKFFIKLPL